MNIIIKLADIKLYFYITRELNFINLDNMIDILT